MLVFCFFVVWFGVRVFFVLGASVLLWGVGCLFVRACPVRVGLVTSWFSLRFFDFSSSAEFCVVLVDLNFAEETDHHTSFEHNERNSGHLRRNRLRGKGVYNVLHCREGFVFLDLVLSSALRLSTCFQPSKVAAFRHASDSPF